MYNDRLQLECHLVAKNPNRKLGIDFDNLPLRIRLRGRFLLYRKEQLPPFFLFTVTGNRTHLNSKLGQENLPGIDETRGDAGG